MQQIEARECARAEAEEALAELTAYIAQQQSADAATAIQQFAALSIAFWGATAQPVTTRALSRSPY